MDSLPTVLNPTEPQINDIQDISGGFSPTSNKEPVYMKPERTLSEIVPLKNETEK